MIPKQDGFDAKFIGEYIAERRAAPKRRPAFPKKSSCNMNHACRGSSRNRRWAAPIPTLGRNRLAAFICAANSAIAAGQINIAVEEEDVRKDRSERFDKGERILPVIAAEIMSWRHRDDQSYRIVFFVQHYETFGLSMMT